MNQSFLTIRIAQLILVAWLAVAAGCSMKGISTDHVWRDSARGDAPLGKTLVLSLTTSTDVSISLENEWTRQLRNRGIEANAANTIMSGNYPANESDIIALVEAENFGTLLVSRLVNVKKVGREASHYQVAMIETKLYDTRTGKPFWTAKAEVFFVSGADNQLRKPQGDKLSRFVESIIQEMTRSKVL